MVKDGSLGMPWNAENYTLICISHHQRCINHQDWLLVALGLVVGLSSCNKHIWVSMCSLKMELLVQICWAYWPIWTIRILDIYSLRGKKSSTGFHMTEAHRESSTAAFGWEHMIPALGCLGLILTRSRIGQRLSDWKLPRSLLTASISHPCTMHVDAPKMAWWQVTWKTCHHAQQGLLPQESPGEVHGPAALWKTADQSEEKIEKHKDHKGCWVPCFQLQVEWSKWGFLPRQRHSLRLQQIGRAEHRHVATCGETLAAGIMDCLGFLEAGSCRCFAAGLQEVPKLGDIQVDQVCAWLRPFCLVLIYSLCIYNFYTYTVYVIICCFILVLYNAMQYNLM